MKISSLILAAVLAFVAVSADAAARFGVCTTTCTWDNASTAMWSTTSGGATGASAPTSADDVTLDAATCVGGTTCTITTNANITAHSLTMGACTASTAGCILDASANNNNFTLVFFSATGTGTRTLKMGSGTWSMSGSALDASNIWDISTSTNITLTAGTSTLAITSTSGAFAVSTQFGTSLTYATLSIAARTDGSTVGLNAGTAVTFGTVILNAPLVLLFNSSITYTITNPIAWTGTSANPFLIQSPNTLNNPIVAVAGGSTINWAAIKALAFTGAPIASNSLDLRGNSGITINAPVVGGGGSRCIGC